MRLAMIVDFHHLLVFTFLSALFTGCGREARLSPRWRWPIVASVDAIALFPVAPTGNAVKHFHAVFYVVLT